MLGRRMLSKEDEASLGSDEVPVRREDQDKINKFSRLNQREALLEEELKTKQKEKEDIEEVSNELELADEDELIPYKVGDSFLSLPAAKVIELLGDEGTRLEGDLEGVRDKLGGLRAEMEELKVALYARFGRSINLES